MAWKWGKSRKRILRGEANEKIPEKWWWTIHSKYFGGRSKTHKGKRYKLYVFRKKLEIDKMERRKSVYVKIWGLQQELCSPKTGLNQTWKFSWWHIQSKGKELFCSASHDKLRFKGNVRELRYALPRS